MNRVFVPTRSAHDWQRLLAKPELHWQPGASAMTAAACWEGANGQLPSEIQSQLDAARDPHLANCRLLIAIPEWEVALPGGTTTSHTDILAICRNDLGLCVIAVEAKVLEDFGPCVGEKRQAPSIGQAERLAFLHKELGVNRFADEIRYQLLHRTASALLTARQFHATTAVMLVHAFDCPPDRKTDFRAFVSAMGASAITSDMFRVQVSSGPRLFLAWCAGNCAYREVDLRRSSSADTVVSGSMS